MFFAEKGVIDQTEIGSSRNVGMVNLLWNSPFPPLNCRKDNKDDSLFQFISKCNDFLTSYLMTDGALMHISSSIQSRTDWDWREINQSINRQSNRGQRQSTKERKWAVKIFISNEDKNLVRIYGNWQILRNSHTEVSGFGVSCLLHCPLHCVSIALRKMELETWILFVLCSALGHTRFLKGLEK